MFKTPDEKKHENYVCLICREIFKDSYLLEEHICIDNDNSFINEYIGAQEKICQNNNNYATVARKFKSGKF